MCLPISLPRLSNSALLLKEPRPRPVDLMCNDVTMFHVCQVYSSCMCLGDSVISAWYMFSFMVIPAVCMWRERFALRLLEPYVALLGITNNISLMHAVSTLL